MEKPQHFYNSIQRASTQEFYTEKLNDDIYLVYSLKSDVIYDVKVYEGKLVSCSCPHSTFRSVICKHISKCSQDFGLRINFELVKP